MKTISGNSLVKNSFYNIIGSIAPLFVALFAIPLLVHGLGEEKFGILSLAWVVIGYFSFFDFGIGRTLTKIIAENIGLDKFDDIPDLFWTALFLMLLISFVGTILLFFGTPFLVLNFLKISKEFQEESIYTFYVLALSVPIVTTTAGLRGVLEAYQKFGTINIIRTILGVSTFAGPLLCLIFTDNLFIIVCFLTFIRLIIWYFYYRECIKLDSIRDIKKNIRKTFIKPILKISTWMSISNLVGPILLYIDRFLIAALISATAVTFYTTPYEVITKILIIPGALTGVLFPAISSTYSTNPVLTKNLLSKSIKYVFIIIFPIVLIIVAFAKEGMNIWLGINFAENSTLILQLFATGILLNSVAFFPFTFLQSIGRPDITAKIHSVELPFYIIAMWYFIPKFGIVGAAMVWLLRIIVDAGLQFYFTKKVFKKLFNYNYQIHLVPAVVSILLMLSSLIISEVLLKSFYVVALLLMFSIIVWKKFLEPDERAFVFSKIRRFRFEK